MKTLIVLALSVFIVACGKIPRCDSERAKDEIESLLITPLIKNKKLDKIFISLSDISQKQLTESGDRYCYARMSIYSDGDSVSIPIDYSFYEDSEGDVNIKVNVNQNATPEETIFWGILRNAVEEANGRK